MLMAAGRLNIPSMMITGGPMRANCRGEQKHHPIEGFGIVGQVKAGKMEASEAEAMLPQMTCGAGSCVGLYTANTMAVVTEVLGMSVSGCAATTALDPKKQVQAYETGRRIVELVRKGVCPRDIMTEASFENAIRVDMAMGGSTNTVLHIPAVAGESGIDLSVEHFDRISRETPNLCSIIPAGSHEMYDIDQAGGIPAVLSRLKPLLNDTRTVEDRTILQVADQASVLNEDIIRPMENPYYTEGGIAVLKGNIARSAVIKQTALDRSMLTHSGPAKVFMSEGDLLDAIEEKKIQEGDVIVLPYQGPAGAPGMPEMLTPTDAIKGAGYQRVALITDGRFSGATTGPCIGHVEMEAYNGGAMGAIRDGDIIEINIPERSLNVKLEPEEIRKRLALTIPPERTVTPLLKSFRERFQGINCYGK
jgi:dihydroxy-acid dehydratase